MASFFQFPNLRPDESTEGRFPILRNDVLPAKERFEHAYQIVVLALGATAFCVGCVLVIVRAVRQHRERLMQLGRAISRFPKSFLQPTETASDDETTWIARHLWKARIPRASPDTSLGLPATDAKSFCITSSGDPVHCVSHDCAVHIISVPENLILHDMAEEAILSDRASNRASRTISSSRRSCSQYSGEFRSRIIVMGSIKLATLETLSAAYEGAAKKGAVTSLLKQYRLSNGFDGLILHHTPGDSEHEMKHVLLQLNQHGIPVFLRLDADSEVLDDLDCSLIEGLILENPCIMPDGTRRDFFRAKRTRLSGAITKRERERRPGFFLGFLEQWDVRPSAAVIRRAYRLADFFGAAVNARSSSRIHAEAVLESPMSGFEWLKKNEVAWLQKTWSHNRRCDMSNGMDPAVFDIDVSPITSIIPSATRLLAPRDVGATDAGAWSFAPTTSSTPNYEHQAPSRKDIWHVSSCGAPLCTLGCFTLREETSQEQFDAVLRIQRSLKDRKLLQPYGDAELLRVADSLKAIIDRTSYGKLLNALIEGLADRTIRVFAGLDSGFSLSDQSGHLWAVVERHLHDDGAKLDIHISKKAAADVPTIWHAYLAEFDVPRLERFEEELLLTAQPSNPSARGLPTSIVHELDNATEAELLRLMQQIRLSESPDHLTSAILVYCRHLLIDETSRRAWVAFHSKACLEEGFSIKDVLRPRLALFARLGAERLPTIENLSEFYALLETELHHAIFHNKRTKANNLTAPILTAYGHAGETGLVTPAADLYGLMFFCALRRLAFENLYLEATDRCPLFLSQPDQAAVFAEMWVLGSQCELYFGLMPRELGEIVYDRYGRHLLHSLPPSTAWDGKEVFTAYSTPELGLPAPEPTPSRYSGSSLSLTEHAHGKPKRNAGPPKVQQIARDLGALSIFCFPAMLDIMCLTFLGRGLFLTFWMDDNVKLMADYAILTALVLTGGIVGWIGSTGGFYLYNSAFDGMVHFLVQRFSGAVILTAGVALCGFLAFGAEYGWFAGFVFLLYLIPLSVFLTLLGIFATMHRNESPFPSGRMAMWKCLPILFISPILSTFIRGWDFLIYILVIYSFTIALLLTFRRLCHEWTDWHLKVPSVKEAAMVTWYKEKHTPEASPLSKASDVNILSMAKAALDAEVSSFRPSPWKKTVPDPFVAKIVAGLPFAQFLLKKECGESQTPVLFSTSWFVQLELALNNQRHLMRGLKQHSDFINYRYSRYDIGQNVGLFLAALLDRLIMITMSARNPNPSELVTPRSRYAIAFALLHFLCGALSVDLVLRRYWSFISPASTEKLADVGTLRDVLQADAKQRRDRYWRALGELMTLMLVSVGMCTMLLWVFVADAQSISLFFIYIVSYTATLICQFHRCFTRSHRFHVITVFMCCALGFFVGVLLRALPMTAGFVFDFAIGQVIATVSAAIGTGILTSYVPYSNPSPTPVKDQETPAPSEPNSKHASLMLSDRLITHASAPCGATHRVYRQILEHLTLGLEVDVVWHTLPEDIRCIIVDRVMGTNGNDVDVHTRISPAHQQLIAEHDEKLQASLTAYGHRFATDVDSQSIVSDTPRLSTSTARKGLQRRLLSVFEATATAIDGLIRWTAIISVAAPDTPRELWYALRDVPLGTSMVWILLKAWKICHWSRNFCTYSLIIAPKKPLSKLLDTLHRGARRTLRGQHVTADTPTWKATGFVLRTSDKEWGLLVYDGLHDQPPNGQRPTAAAFYDKEYRLCHRQIFHADDRKPTDTFYYYNTMASTRWPISKTTLESNEELHTTYDSRGRPVSGEMIRNQVKFDYWFEFSATHNDEVVRATYKSQAGAQMCVSVSWCVRPWNVSSEHIEDWIPSEKVQSVLAVIEGQTYEVKWAYKHARGPEVEASIVDKRGKRRPCLAPVQIMSDSFGFLQKPHNVGFDRDDLLCYHPASSLRKLGRRGNNSHNTTWTKLFRPLRALGFGEKVVYHKLSSSTLRTALWSSWAKAPYVDAAAAGYLDEMIMRKEPLLQKYWSRRDAGRLSEAANALDENLESVISAIEPSHEASQTCPLLIKPADLFVAGLGKDANQLTARLTDAYRDTESGTSVIFSDNGCWPDNPGGVSNCRRDLVNGHTTIRGHCLAESANDYGIPRYQIERNVNTLKVLPLWGLDRKTAYHGLFDNLLQSQVDEKLDATRIQDDIEGTFVPLLQEFIRGARTKRLSSEDIVRYSNTVMKIAKYFERCDYNKTWNSEQVWTAWLTAWLHDHHDPNILSISEWLEIEQPSLNDFREALNLYISYFFIFSVEVPDDCPKVFQTTHHGIGSLWGMLLKYRRGTTWGLWDHAILWRETCLNLSPAQCLLPLSVQAMLLAGIKLACHLAYTHTDIVLPCTSVFNPEWEQSLGTDDGRRGSKKHFARKIDPIVNGISNMDNFKPVEKIRSSLPTTVMLSNVQFIKDVKNAVLAADIIINEYGFSDYRLVIYGAQDRQPAYALETAMMINQRGLMGKVTLAGFGTPKEVLKDAWLFMNSSLSEGLPLAIGEAALSGVPIVATEVGATSLVLTDPDDMTTRYGEVVPPNDPESLARAQISILAMMGPWAKYAGTSEELPLPDNFTAEDVERITKRMYEKVEERRALGLRLREVVLRSFHGHRYLREHEQMFWIQRRRAEIRRSDTIRPHPPMADVFGEQADFKPKLTALADGDRPRPRWQDFDLDKVRRRIRKRKQNAEHYVELGSV